MWQWRKTERCHKFGWLGLEAFCGFVWVCVGATRRYHDTFIAFALSLLLDEQGTS